MGRLLIALLVMNDDATDDQDAATTVDGARRKIKEAYDRARAANRRNRLGEPLTRPGQVGGS